VHQRVARGGCGERVERRLGLVEPALRDQVAREEECKRWGTLEAEVERAP